MIVEANNLSVLEYKEFKKITKESLSTKLYFKSLDLVKQLNNERIYMDLKQSINSFHMGLDKWSKFEENFFNNTYLDQSPPKLTFDNYSDYVLLIKDQNLLIRNWEEYIQSTYGNLLGYVCSSMALLGDHNYNTWKHSFDFGSNFAFNYIVNQQFTSYFNEANKESFNLQLPILIYLKLIKDDDKRKKLIETILSKNNSLTSLELKTEIKNSDDTLKQIKQYGQTYLNQTNNCLRKLQESDSKLALLQISNSLLDF